MSISAKRAIEKTANIGAIPLDQRFEPIGQGRAAEARVRIAFSREPAIRQARVMELRKRIRQGTFCPADDEIAQAILADCTTKRI